MKQILISLSIFGLICANLISLSGQFYYPGDSDSELIITNELYADASQSDIDWVLENPSILEEEDRIEAIDDYHTLSVNPFLNADFCWRGSYGRGVGKVPDVCPRGMQMQAGLCYRACFPGYKGVGPICWQSCPSSFDDHGAFCRKPKEYWRGGSNYALWNKWKCERDHGSCEKSGAFYYPKCKEGFYAVACCICSPKCPYGFRDWGVSCQKNSYSRGVGIVPKACSSGREYDAGLCYNRCRSGFDGVGPVCWENTCPQNWVNCGAGCAEDGLACGLAITDMVVGPLQVVLNVVSFGASGGVSGAINGAKASALAAKYSASAAIGGAAAVAKGTSSVVSAGTVTASILLEAAQQGLDIVGEAKDKVEQFSDIVVDAERTNPEFDWKELLALEPTGIVSCALAFAKPMCEDVRNGQTTSVTRPISSQTVRPFSGWKQNRGNMADLSAKNGNIVYGVQSNGTVWRSTDGGNYFTQPHTGARLSQVSTVDANIFWGVNSNQKLYRSTDGGKNYTDFGPGIAYVSALGQNEAWFLKTDGTVWRTNRGGGQGTWEQPHSQARLIQISAVSYDIAWGVQSNGSVWRTKDGGKSWQRTPGGLKEVSALSYDQTWGVNSNGQIYRTVNGGGHWESIYGTLNHISASDINTVHGTQSNEYHFRSN